MNQRTKAKMRHYLKLRKKSQEYGICSGCFEKSLNLILALDDKKGKA